MRYQGIIIGWRGVSLSWQSAEMLQKDIAAGKYRDRRQASSERFLAQDLKASYLTVRQRVGCAGTQGTDAARAWHAPVSMPPSPTPSSAFFSGRAWWRKALTFNELSWKHAGAEVPRYLFTCRRLATASIITLVCIRSRNLGLTSNCCAIPKAILFTVSSRSA